jgi:hypothetical protein
MIISTNPTRLLAIAALILGLLSSITHASQEATDPAVASLTGIMISFKLDPRITRGMYMGERWVSPYTYTSLGLKDEREVTVSAKAVGINAQGKQVGINPIWKTIDVEMITVFPSQGSAVTITVHRAGKSSLTVTYGTISKKLTVKAAAVSLGGTLRVDISQLPGGKPTKHR